MVRKVLEKCIRTYLGPVLIMKDSGGSFRVFSNFSPPHDESRFTCHHFFCFSPDREQVCGCEHQALDRAHSPSQNSAPEGKTETLLSRMIRMVIIFFVAAETQAHAAAAPKPPPEANQPTASAPQKGGPVTTLPPSELIMMTGCYGHKYNRAWTVTSCNIDLSGA